MEDTYFVMVFILLLIDSKENGIEKSPNDPQHYYSFTLENGLTTLLIKDEGADISNVCMSVNAGSLNDPSDIPGLAHFVEVFKCCSFNVCSICCLWVLKHIQKKMHTIVFYHRITVHRMPTPPQSLQTFSLL